MAIVIRTTGIEDYLESGQANVKAMVIGDPGVGKSVGASFWPKPIFLHCDIKPPLSLARRNVPLADIRSQADMDTVLMQLEADNRKPLAERRFRTAVIDTIDAYQNLVILDRLNQTHKESLSGFEDWGYLDSKMKAMFARLMKLDMNVVINVHLKRTQEGKGDDATTLLGLKIKGDLRDVLPSECNLIGYMHTDYEARGEGDQRKREVVRYIQWGQTPEFPILRDDTNTLPFKTPVNFADSDFEQLWIAMFGDTAGLDGMAESVVVETLEQAAPPEVVPPTAGGPVQPKVHTEAAPKKAAVPAVKASPSVGAVPAVAKPTVASSAAPVATAVPSEDAAPPAAAPAETVPAAAAQEPAATPVAEPYVPPEPGTDPSPAADGAAVEGASAPEAAGAASGEEFTLQAEQEQATPAPEPTAQEVVEEVLGGTVIEPAEAAAAPVNAVPEPTAPPAPAAPVNHCGDKARPDGPDPKPGCGRDLADLSDVERAQVNIAIMKHKTMLCPACLQAANAAA